MSLQRLHNNVVNVWGEAGQAWLNKLPQTIDALRQQWQLNDIEPVANLSYNYVARAKQHNTPVVLKFSCDKALIADEHRALIHFNGIHCIKVIDYCAEHHALLLEQATPGHSLKAMRAHHCDELFSIYTKQLHALTQQASMPDNTTHVDKWCRAIDRISDARIHEKHVKRAKLLRNHLVQSAPHEYLCHGDLHLDNILQHHNDWLRIDPKGIVGEMAFEAAAFDLFSDDEWQQPDATTTTLNQRINALATAAQLCEQRLLAWFYLRAIISAQWFVEDNGNPDAALRLAAMLYPLLEDMVHRIEEANGC